MKVILNDNLNEQNREQRISLTHKTHAAAVCMDAGSDREENEK